MRDAAHMGATGSAPSSPAWALALAVIALWIAWGDAYGANIERMVGRASDPRTGRFLYEERHWIRTVSGQRTRVVVYHCPDGRAFARKRVLDTAIPGAPAFDFTDARDGYREGVDGQARQRRVYWRASASARARERTMEMGADTVIDAGFDEWVRHRWSALVAGNPVQARFLIPSRGVLVPVKVQRVGKPAGDTVRFRLALDSWLDFVAPAVHIAYDPTTRRLRTFEGIGTIRSEGGDPLPVRIEFVPSEKNDASVRDYEQAETGRLNGRCG
jgi:hypothetical protein